MFYTVVFRKSAQVWVALCLENGLVGQGESKPTAMQKLLDAITSLDEARVAEPDLYTAPLSLGELHEFLTLGETPIPDTYELQTVAWRA
jgi:hypothetical protein